MIIYLKGYYGFKNLGDELLLFGVLHWLVKEYSPHTILIESGNTQRLTQRLSTNDRALPSPNNTTITPVSKKSNLRTKRDLTVFGGGEVVSAARPFPYNGWTYIALFFRTLRRKQYIILGGVGTPKTLSTKLLYTFFLKRAKQIIVRDKHSYAVAKQYSHNTTLYKDFCYDFLAHYISHHPQKPQPKDHLIINVNKYIRSEKTKNTLLERAQQYTTIYYLPGELGSDDHFFAELQQSIPNLQLLEWTQRPIEETIQIISTAQYGVAARLHVLLLLDYFGVPYTPLVYQEKINHVLGVPKT